ncbi:MAG: hypothetical protein ACI4JS_06475 [Oscillospiraceae bacterium]
MSKSIVSQIEEYWGNFLVKWKDDLAKLFFKEHMVNILKPAQEIDDDAMKLETIIESFSKELDIINRNREL